LVFSSGPALPIDEVAMQSVYDLAPVIAEIISGHCAGTRAREDFVHACLHGDWHEAKVMVEGMLAEPWHLIGHQEQRLREFLDLLQLRDGTLVSQ
jgi:hypothetical protein